MAVTVLLCLPEGFEELEAIAPCDLLRRAGAEVTLAALTDDLLVVGRNAIAIRADTTLERVRETAFDCIVLPGGPGTARLRRDPRVLQLIRRQHEAGRWLAAICAAPAALHDAGLLAGRRYTAHFSVEKELPEIQAQERVIADGRIITSRGAGTAADFGLLLVEKLFSAEKAREIARSICA